MLQGLLCRRNRNSQDCCLEETGTVRIVVSRKQEQSGLLYRGNRNSQDCCLEETGTVRIVVSRKQEQSIHDFMQQYSQFMILCNNPRENEKNTITIYVFSPKVIQTENDASVISNRFVYDAVCNIRYENRTAFEC
jgi:hypothetical protein